MATVNAKISTWGLEGLYYNEQFRLDQVLDKEPRELSGGEQQKIAILVALCKNHNVLILDEPTSAMDQKSIDILIDFLDLYKTYHIVICITHEPKLISASDSILELHRQN